MTVPATTTGQLALLGDPTVLRDMTDAELRTKASEVASFLRQGLAGFKALVGCVLAEAGDRWGVESEEFVDLRDQYLKMLKVDRSTLWRWRLDGAKRLGPRRETRQVASGNRGVVIDTKAAHAIEAAGPEPTTPESSAAVPTTVSEHGPDAGEELVPLPGSGHPQSPDGAKGTGVRAESQIRHDGEQARPSADAQAATGLSSSPTPEEQSGAASPPTPPRAPTSSGSARPVGAAGRSASARPAGTSIGGHGSAKEQDGENRVSGGASASSGGPDDGPDTDTLGRAEPTVEDVTVEQAEEAMALLCRARDVVITNSNPFLRAKTLQKLGGPQQLTSEFHQVSSESGRLNSKPSKPNGTSPRPFAGPIPKVGKR